MSGLCGWFHCGASSRSSDPAIIGSMGATLASRDEAPIRAMSTDWAGIAVAGRPQGVDVYRDPERLAGVWGDLRFNNEQLRELARRHGVGFAFAKGYLEKGPDVLQAMSGSFAVAMLDRSNRQAFLATDRMGVRPLFHTMADQTLVFGSSLDAIDGFPGVRREVSGQAVYDYVYFHVVPSPGTIYEGRSRLLPGTRLLCRNGVVQTSPYWQVPFDEHEVRPFKELKTEFVELLRDSVARCAGGGRTGAFLSGGTDSSTLAGMLREVTGDAPRTYSIGFEAEGFDEMRYARIAAQHFGTRHNEYYVTPADVVAAIPKIAAVHDQPFGNSSSVPTYYCAKLAKEDGIEVLLGGDGGDELFGGNSRYALQYLYSLYSDLPERLRSRWIEPVAFGLPAAAAGKVQRYIRSASMPMPARYDKYNLVEHFGVAAVFTPEFLGGVDIAGPRSAMTDYYGQSTAKTLINRMLAFDFKYTLADNDLPKVARSCELAAMEVAFPMLDDALVAFAARLAPDMKLKGVRLRYFFKQALKDFLPAEILAKKKHGFGLPFGPWLLTHGPLAELALDSLSDLKKRAIVQPSFIDELASIHVRRHSNYFSTMVWVLMMLEQWFKREAVQARSFPDAPIETSMECTS